MLRIKAIGVGGEILILAL